MLARTDSTTAALSGFAIVQGKSVAMILDHLTLHVADYAKSRQFYLRALAPLEIGIVVEFGEVAGFGRDGKGELWLAGGQAYPPMHIAFAARTRAEVDAFHTAALAAGAKDNGAPGIRAVYHPHYYGAFAIAPEGHNIEAVCHLPG
jgi:catechol 2,3-dioxygenase-like lactoylglutathione lyase family enzyme